MVYTRSGKSTNALGSTLFGTSSSSTSNESLPRRKQAKRKAMEIFSEIEMSNSTIFNKPVEGLSTAVNDENANNNVKALCATPSANKAAKKPRVLAESSLVNVLNSTINAALTISPSKKEVKKVALSVEEKAMNGAPEGDLYDVMLLEDSALSPFASTELAKEELLRQLHLFPKLAVWAEKYETITIIRRIAHCHGELLRESESDMKQTIDCLLDQIASLRSTNVRNALLCLKRLSHTCNDALWRSKGRVNAIFTALLLKSGNGPKFLCDAAYEASQAAAETCAPTLLVEALQPLVTHKNLEVSSKSIFLVAQSVLRCSSDMLQSWQNKNGDDSNGEYTLKSMLCVLAAALSAKKAQAKDKSREALLFVKQSLGDESFAAFLGKKLPPTVAAEIQRELEKSSSSLTTSLSSSKLSTATVSSSLPNNNKPKPKSWTSTATSAVTSKPWAKPQAPVAVSVTGSDASTLPAVARKPWERPALKTQPTKAPAVKTDANQQEFTTVSKENIMDLPSMDALDGLEDLI